MLEKRKTSLHSIKMLTSFAIAAMSLHHALSLSVGTIKWDAWNVLPSTQDYDEVSSYVHSTMSPSHWNYRLPFYGKVLSETNVSFNEDLQSVIDEEILYASHAGINYFAFDFYCQFGPNCATQSKYCQRYATINSPQYCPQNPTYGLDLYLKSSHLDLLNFSLVLLGSTVCDPRNIASYLYYMTHASFQKVLGNRPLVYLFQFDSGEADFCGGWGARRRQSCL